MKTRDVGRERAGKLGLVGAELQHDHRAVGGRVEVEDAAPDIAGEFRGRAGLGQHMRDEGRGPSICHWCR